MLTSDSRGHTVWAIALGVALIMGCATDDGEPEHLADRQAGCAVDAGYPRTLAQPLTRRWTLTASTIQSDSQFDVERTSGLRRLCTHLLAVTAAPGQPDDGTGRRQLLGDRVLASVDPASGTVLWRSALPAGAACASAPLTSGRLPCVVDPRAFNERYCGFASINSDMVPCRGGVAPGSSDAAGVVIHFYDLNSGAHSAQAHPTVDDVAVVGGDLVTAGFRATGEVGSVQVRRVSPRGMVWATTMPVPRVARPWRGQPSYAEDAHLGTYGTGFLGVSGGDHGSAIVAADSGEVVASVPNVGGSYRGFALPGNRIAVLRADGAEIRDQAGRIVRRHPGAYTDVSMSSESRVQHGIYRLRASSSSIARQKFPTFDAVTGRELPSLPVSVAGYPYAAEPVPVLTTERITVLRSTSGYPTLGQTVNYEAAVDNYSGAVLWIHRGVLGRMSHPTGGVALARSEDRATPKVLRAVDLRGGQILWSLADGPASTLDDGLYEVNESLIARWG